MALLMVGHGPHCRGAPEPPDARHKVDAPISGAPPRCCSEAWERRESGVPHAVDDGAVDDAQHMRRAPRGPGRSAQPHTVVAQQHMLTHHPCRRLAFGTLPPNPQTRVSTRPSCCFLPGGWFLRFSDCSWSTFNGVFWGEGCLFSPGCSQFRACFWPVPGLCRPRQATHILALQGFPGRRTEVVFEQRGETVISETSEPKATGAHQS